MAAAEAMYIAIITAAVILETIFRAAQSCSGEVIGVVIQVDCYFDELLDGLLYNTDDALRP